jgi:hypothetical protein
MGFVASSRKYQIYLRREILAGAVGFEIAFPTKTKQVLHGQWRGAAASASIVGKRC